MVDERSSRADEFIARLGLSVQLEEKLRSARRAYVVGMGPSIGKFDLHSLADGPVFGVNHAAVMGLDHDLLFLADDRRLVPELHAGNVPIVTIDACLQGNEGFFADLDHFADIKAVHYAQKIPAILDIDAYPEGLPLAYWTGSVVTDLVVPFAVECGIDELVCLGLDGIEGSFPVTHAWGMDSLTRQLQKTSASTEPEVLPTAAMVAHLQEKAAALAAAAGTRVLNATPGGATEALRRVDPHTAMPPGTWLEATEVEPLHESALAIGTSIFTLQARTSRTAMLSHSRTVSKRADHSHLHGAEFVLEVGFIGPGHFALRSTSQACYLTTRSGFDQYQLRTPTQSFNTTLSSFRAGLTQAEAVAQAELIAKLAELADQRAAIGDRLADLYLGAASEVERG
ncbi:MULTISPECIES: hypothetical protein [Brachybacterium]|uniref:DUF1152 domain-containing protein n=2 Tax=Brachybacterium TaxID=43668 RepID=A0ABW0FCS1_9MICO